MKVEKTYKFSIWLNPKYCKKINNQQPNFE